MTLWKQKKSWKLQEETIYIYIYIYISVWTALFGRRYGPVARQTTKWMALQSPCTFLRACEWDRKNPSFNFYFIFPSFKVQEHLYLDIYFYRRFVDKTFKKGRGERTIFCVFLWFLQLSCQYIDLIDPMAKKKRNIVKCGGILLRGKYGTSARERSCHGFTLSTRNPRWNALKSDPNILADEAAIWVTWCLSIVYSRTQNIHVLAVLPVWCFISAVHDCGVGWTCCLLCHLRKTRSLGHSGYCLISSYSHVTRTTADAISIVPKKWFPCWGHMFPLKVCS